MSATVTARMLPGAAGAARSVQARVRARATGESRDSWPAASSARTRKTNVVAQASPSAVMGAARPRATTLPLLVSNS